MAKIKNVAYAVLVIFLVSFFLGCIGTKETKLEPRAEGKALYSYITAGNNYKDWDKWPGTGEFYPKSAGSPHGDLLITYVNDKGLSEIQGEGKVGMCNDCHGKQKDNDYTFTGPLK